MDENIWMKKRWTWKKIGLGEHERSKQKICKLAKKVEIFNWKNLVDKIHKELKLNVYCHIKRGRNYNLFQV